MKIIPEVKNLTLVPQISAGRFTKNGTDFSGGSYFSAEVDIMFKLGKTTGISFKPYLFSLITSPENNLQFGLKIGFSKFIKNTGLSSLE